MDTIRIVVIEDNRLLRDGISTMLEDTPDVKIVSSFGDNDKIVDKIREAEPHVVLLDIGLGNKNSLNVVKTVKKEKPAIKIIAMGMIPAVDDVYAFVQTGVSGFIVKDATVANFLKTIKTIAQGKNVLPVSLTESLFSQIVTQAIKREVKPEEVEDAIQFSKREQQIIIMIADGLENKEIAVKLNLSYYTIKSHVHNILVKLEIRNRIQIATYARTNKDFKDKVNSISLLGE